ncbi:MAG: hypothetical protein OXR73_08115 [Myxococcales bacterium]|nr:hypothetical protein [Myxococcales bacterium]
MPRRRIWSDSRAATGPSGRVPYPLSDTALSLVLLVAAGCGDHGCGGGAGTPKAEVEPSAQPLPAKETSSGSASPSPSPSPSPSKEGTQDKQPTSSKKEKQTQRPPRPGWNYVQFEDTVPLCALKSLDELYETDFLGGVPPQQLEANQAVHLASHAGWCVHDDCDARSSLQVTVDREGSRLVVHTRYWGERKDNSACGAKDCRPIFASGPTPELEPGVYTIEYGDRVFELRIPSRLADPCFGTNDAVRKWPERTVP